VTAVAVNTERAAVLEEYGRIYGSLRLAVSWTDGLESTAAKTAHHWQSRPDRLASEEHGAGLFRRGLNRNPVVSLRASNLIGVDIDGESGRALARKLVPGGFPATVTVKSGRADGGHHLWYRPPNEARHAKIQLSGGGLELIGDGYLVIPPAIHGDTGRPYEFVPGRAPWEHEIAILPADLLASLLRHDGRVDAAERADDSAPIPEGRRHLHLRRLAGAMRRVGAGEATIVAALLVENERRCQPPKDERLVRELARDIVKRYRPGVAA
jgi:hypothetical protein